MSGGMGFRPGIHGMEDLEDDEDMMLDDDDFENYWLRYMDSPHNMPGRKNGHFSGGFTSASA